MRVFLIVSIFLVSVILMYRKKMNTLVGLPVMAILIGIAAGIPFTGLLNEVISEGAMRLHNPIIVIIFGATLAEIVKRSGIVEVMIKNTAEFLGDRLLLISIFLMMVIALLFTVLSGLGAIVMVGSIVFPIMISLGMSRLLAASVFLIGLSLGGTLNLVNWSLFTDVLKLSQGDILRYCLWFFPMAVMVSIGFVAFELQREGGSAFKLSLKIRTEQKPVHWLAFLTPVIPVVLIFATSLVGLVRGGADGFEFPIVAAMFLGIIYGTVTAPRAAGPKVRLLTRAIFDGIEQVGPAIALMIGIGMLLKSVAHPNVKLLLDPLMHSILPGTAWGYVVFFTVAAPLSLYRGPLNLWGMGSGLVVLVKDTGLLPPAAIMAALLAVGQMQGVSDPTNTYNVWIANYLGIDVIKITQRTLVATWVMATFGLLIAARMYF